MTNDDQLTRADLAGMTPEQIVEAKAAGRCDQILGIHVSEEETLLLARATNEVLGTRLPSRNSPPVADTT